MSARTRSVFHNLVVVRYREVVFWDEVMERALKSGPGRLPAVLDSTLPSQQIHFLNSTPAVVYF